MTTSRHDSITSKHSSSLNGQPGSKLCCGGQILVDRDFLICPEIIVIDPRLPGPSSYSCPFNLNVDDDDDDDDYDDDDDVGREAKEGFY